MNFLGDEKGIAVLNKLWQLSATDEKVRWYVNNLNKVASTDGKAFFTDISEQYKKPLNNQNCYYLFYNQEKNAWNVQLFLDVSNQFS